MKDRGIYRSIYCALYDDPDFQQLSSEARQVLIYLRTSPLSNIPCIYPLYREAICFHTGLSKKTINRVLDTLCDRDWIAIQKHIVWVKNALKFEPTFSLQNPKHISALKKIVSGLPRLKIVEDFITYYNLPIPYEIPYPIGNDIPYAIPVTGTGTETEEILLCGREATRTCSPQKKYSEDFQKWWAIYPGRRKTSKPQVFKKWEVLRKSGELLPIGDMMAVLRAQINSPDWSKDNGNYIPGPLPYLNKLKFLDESVTATHSRTKPRAVCQHGAYKDKCQLCREDINHAQSN